MSRLRSKRGMAYFLALITLVSGLVLVCAVMRIAGGQAIAETKRETKREALFLADAGIAYAHHLCKWTNLRTRPYSETVNLPNGSFSISLNSYWTVPGTVKVTSIGRVRGSTASRTAVLLTEHPFRYAYASLEYDIYLNKPLSSTSRAEMFFDEDVIFDNWGISLAGPVTSGEDISVWRGSISGPTREYVQSFVWPEIDLNYYRSVASIYYNSNTTLNSLVFPFDGAVLYCNGDLKLQGPITGSGTVVASNKIEITNSVNMQNGKALGCLANNEITIKAAASSFEGVCYVPNGLLKIDGATALNGSFAAGYVRLMANGVSYDYDPAKWNPATFSLLRLPGFY